MRKLLLPAAIASLGLWASLSPPQASAQPTLVSSYPGPDSRLGQPPPVVRLCFSEPLAHASPSQYRASVTDALGTPLPATIAFSQDATCLLLTPQWPQGSKGRFSVFFQVRSQATGEPTTGSLSFQVGVGAARPDLLRYPLLTAIAAAGAAFLGLLLAGLRRLVGYEPHRPRREAQTSSHH
ncbi:MAG: copper resistance protein CopC [Dehalococcoidia bacterium]|nr:copper resistance protein CopC [Dehalococcoidia bacterium]